jgi:hypothetical protein
MNRKLQIVVSSRPPTGPAGLPLSSLTFWQRFKLRILIVAIAVAAMTVLVAALLLGFIIAAVVWIVLMVVIMAILFKTMLRRIRSSG